MDDSSALHSEHKPERKRRVMVQEHRVPTADETEALYKRLMAKRAKKEEGK